MKTLLLSVIAFFCVAIASAQRPAYPGSKDKLREAIYLQLLGTSTPLFAGKTTATAERLIARTTRTWVDTGTGPTLTPYDSTDHRYSGGRGSDFNFNIMDFLQVYAIYANDYMGQGIYNGFRNRDNKMALLSDSTREYFLDTTMKLFYVYNYQYNTQNNITEHMTRDLFFGYNERINITYNAAERPALATFSSQSGSAWDTFSYRTMNYTGDSITFDSSSYKDAGIWDPQNTFSYSYNTDGSLAVAVCNVYDVPTATWYAARRYTLEYYASGKIKKMAIEIAGPSNPYQLMQVDSFGWNTAGYADLALYRYYSLGTPNFRELYTKHVGTAMLPDTTFYTYDNLVATEPLNDRITVWTYDSYNNPTLASTYIRTSATAPYDSLLEETRYYYETYTTSGISNVAHANKLHIYPNPAANTIRIELSTTANSRLSRVLVYNMAGILVQNITMQHGVDSYDISTLPPGTYIFAAFSDNGQLAGTRSISKL